MKKIYDKYSDIPESLKEFAISKDSGEDENGKPIVWYEVEFPPTTTCYDDRQQQMLEEQAEYEGMVNLDDGVSNWIGESDTIENDESYLTKLRQSKSYVTNVLKPGVEDNEFSKDELLERINKLEEMLS